MLLLPFHFVFRHCSSGPIRSWRPLWATHAPWRRNHFPWNMSGYVRANKAVLPVLLNIHAKTEIKLCRDVVYYGNFLWKSFCPSCTLQCWSPTTSSAFKEWWTGCGKTGFGLALHPSLIAEQKSCSGALKLQKGAPTSATSLVTKLRLGTSFVARLSAPARLPARLPTLPFLLLSLPSTQSIFHGPPHQRLLKKCQRVQAR